MVVFAIWRTFSWGSFLWLKTENYAGTVTGKQRRLMTIRACSKHNDDMRALTLRNHFLHIPCTPTLRNHFVHILCAIT